MLDYKEIGLQDAGIYAQYWGQLPQQSSDYSFPVVWGWSQPCGMKVAFEDGLCWIRQTKPDVYDLAPVGNWQRDDWEQLLRSHYGDSSRFWLVPDELAKIWQTQFPKALLLEEARGNWEYLYDIHELAELKGRKYMRKRNHINHFKRLYNYAYKPITAENIVAVRDFQIRWFDKSHGYLPGLKEENISILRILDNWHKVPHLCGGIIEVEGNIVAYTIGELTGSSLMVHFEKALEEYDAGYQIINQEFLQRMAAEHPGLETVNREEDLGDEGLREAKLSYRPTGFVKKYKITVKFD